MLVGGIAEIVAQICTSLPAQLEKLPNVTGVEFEQRPPCAADAFTRWENEHAPFRLPDDCKKFYSITNGFHLFWRTLERGPPSTVPFGMLSINRLEEVIPLLDFFATANPNEPTDSTFPTAKAFDLDALCDCGRLALLYRGALAPPEVWRSLSAQHPSSSYLLLHVLSNVMVQVWLQARTSMRRFFIASTFADFVRLMVAHRGLPHWPMAFTDVGLDASTRVGPTGGERRMEAR